MMARDGDEQRVSARLDALFQPTNMRRTPTLRWLSGSTQDAINTPLPQRPQPARIQQQSSLRSSHAVMHPPPFFDNLTRSTLPTASVSPPLPVRAESSFPTSAEPLDDVVDAAMPIPRPAPIVLSSAHPTRTSIDSLRSLSARSMSTYSAATDTASAAALTAPEGPNSPNVSLASFLPSWLQAISTEAKDKQKEALLSEEDRNSKEDVKKKYLSPRNPVVFCHGLLGFDSVTIGPSLAPFEVTHWRGIKEVLEENGTEVLITRVPATSSPADRAKVLEEKISSVYPGRSVHLIGHSMGGLDCRYLASQLPHPDFTVLSITTIATPHRGSSFADHFLQTVGRTRMPQVLSLLDMLPNGGGDGTAFESLTVESMRRFNEQCPDAPGVKYFSWGAVYDPGLIDTWKWPHSVIMEKEGPNDGLVSVESSKWGTYLGTVTNVNHLDLVGWINTARYKWAEMLGKEIKFRPATFYLGIADMLAREVEGLSDGCRSQSPSPSATPTSSHPATPRPGTPSVDKKASESAAGRGKGVDTGKAGKGVELAEEKTASSPSSSSSSSQPHSARASTEERRQGHAQSQMVKSLRHAGADVHSLHSGDAQAHVGRSQTSSPASAPSSREQPKRQASTVQGGLLFDADIEEEKIRKSLEEEETARRSLEETEVKKEKKEEEDDDVEDDGDTTPTMQQSTATVKPNEVRIPTSTGARQNQPPRSLAAHGRAV